MIRIIGDPDNQRPDKWSSTVLNTWHGSAFQSVFNYVRNTMCSSILPF